LNLKSVAANQSVLLSILFLFSAVFPLGLVGQGCLEHYNPYCETNPQYKCATPCVINVIDDGHGSVTLTRADGVTPADVVCVVGKTVIKWNEQGVGSSNFFLRFVTPGANLLFTDHRTVLYADSGTHSDQGTVRDVNVNPKPKECNKYSVTHCTDGVATCPKKDPKVIVNGGGGGGDGPGKH